MDITIPTWLVTVGTLILTTGISTIVGLIIKTSVTKYFKRREELSAKQQVEEEELRLLKQEKANLKQMQDIKETIESVVKPVEDKVDVLTDKLEKNSNGILSALRNDILTCYYRCVVKGYRNDYDYTNFCDLYEAYTDLGGNSFVEDIKERFDNLMTKEDFKQAYPTRKLNKKTTKTTEQ